MQQRAEEILGLLGDGRRSRETQAVVEQIDERLVEHEPDPQLRRLAEVLILARRQAVMQAQLDDDREALHHEHLTHEEHISVGHHYEMLRHQACTYNHLLRGLIESGSQHFTRDELMAWMTGASFGRDAWAKGEVTGAVTEIALHAALQGLPELRNVRYGSVEEDLTGYDFVAEWYGKLLTIDAKTGHYPPLSELKHGHRHLEISVPREAIRDLRIGRRDLALVRGEVRLALRPMVEAPGLDVAAYPARLAVA